VAAKSVHEVIYFCVESDVKPYVSPRARGALTRVQALGNHLSDILADEMADMSVIVEQVKDESRRKELRSNDDEEDYLDEGFAFTYLLHARTVVTVLCSLVAFPVTETRMQHSDALGKNVIHTEP